MQTETAKYFRSCRGTASAINSHLLPFYALKQYDLGSLGHVSEYLASNKAAVDSLATSGGMLVFMGHGENSTDAAALSELLDYVQSKGIPIVTMDRALDLMLSGNATFQ